MHFFDVGTLHLETWSFSLLPNYEGMSIAWGKPWQTLVANVPFDMWTENIRHMPHFHASHMMSRLSERKCPTFVFGLSWDMWKPIVFTEYCQLRSVFCLIVMQAAEDLIIETRVEKWHQGHHCFLYCICWWIWFSSVQLFMFHYLPESRECP